MSPKNRIVPVFIPHLGCPYHCVFCNQNHITGEDYAASKETVIQTLKSAGCDSMSPCPVGSSMELAFYGGSFTAIPRAVQMQLLSAIRPFQQTGWIHSVRCSTRPDAISDDILDQISSMGVETIELGCQSMFDDVLLSCGRGHSSADIIEACKTIKRHKMSLILQMMTGLPGSSEEKDIETAHRLIALQPDGVRIYPTVIIQNTELYKRWINGEYREHTVEDAIQTCSRIVPLFERAGIPIIRLGLNPSEYLSGGGAAGGAYHPAFGEMVYSRIMLDQARKSLDGLESVFSIELHVYPSDISKMTGQHRINLETLMQEYKCCHIRVCADTDIPKGSVAIRSLQSK